MVVGRVEHRLIDVDAEATELVDEVCEGREAGQRPVVDLGAEERADVALNRVRPGESSAACGQRRVAIVG